MNRIYILIPFFIFSVLLSGCKETFLGSDPANKPEENFEILWKDFDRSYSFFELKNVDWDSVYSVYKPRASSVSSDEELFDLLSEMLGILKDGHVNLYTPTETFSYTGWFEPFPSNFFPSVIRFTYSRTFDVSQHERLIFSELSENNGSISFPLDIGYVYIPTFNGENRSFADDIDQVLQQLSDQQALIIDVRDNNGGSDRNVEIVASRFADRERLYRKIRYKDGPEHDDFTSLQDDFIEPNGSSPVVKPVALLTNRKSFSAAETFVLAMREFPNVTVIGDTTGGGEGNPVFRELPNGWVYRLSRWHQLTKNEQHFEGSGIPPDIPVWIKEADLINQRDTILDAAIDRLEDQADDTTN